MQETSFQPPEQPIELPMPRVTLWRMLVEPWCPPDTLESGIAIPEMAQDNAALLTIVGQIRAMGEQCFQKESLKDSGNPKVGDWIIYGAYAGQKVEMADGREFRIVDDDKVIAVVDDPRHLRMPYI